MRRCRWIALAARVVGQPLLPRSGDAGLRPRRLLVAALRRWSRDVGRPRREVVEATRNSALLLNVMGFRRRGNPGGGSAASLPRHRPGVRSIWCDLGLHDPFTGHDRHVTVGERIGEPDYSPPLRAQMDPRLSRPWPWGSGPRFRPRRLHQRWQLARPVRTTRVREGAPTGSGRTSSGGSSSFRI